MQLQLGGEVGGGGAKGALCCLWEQPGKRTAAATALRETYFSVRECKLHAHVSICIGTTRVKG